MGFFETLGWKMHFLRGLRKCFPIGAPSSLASLPLSLHLKKISAEVPRSLRGRLLLICEKAPVDRLIVFGRRYFPEPERAARAAGAAATLPVLSVLSLCSLCAFSVLSLCSLCALSVLSLCYPSPCALSVLSLCSLCALCALSVFSVLSLLSLCSFCAVQ